MIVNYKAVPMSEPEPESNKSIALLQKEDETTDGDISISDNPELVSS